MKPELEKLLDRLKQDSEHVLEMCKEKANENTKLKLEILALKRKNERLAGMPGMYHATKVIELQMQVDHLEGEIKNAYDYLYATYGELEGCEPEKQIIKSFRKVLYV